IFFFQAEDGIRDRNVTGVQTCALPIFGPKVKKILVVGPLAESTEVLFGNYNGIPSHAVSVLEGMQKQFPGAQVTYQPGTSFLSRSEERRVGKECSSWWSQDRVKKTRYR